MILVIPSIRNINMEYIKGLYPKLRKIIIVDDTDEERIDVKDEKVITLHYSDRPKMLGDLEWCIPKKNGVVRDFGLFYAYHIGKSHETVVCLDDDCEVYDDYYKKAENSLGKKTVKYVTTKYRFYNPLDIYDYDKEIFPRGFPYEERGRLKDYNYKKSIKGNVVFNLGLWRGIFDINAIDKMYLEQFAFDDINLRYSQVAVQNGALVSLCSMNMIMQREVIPAIYQVPMNEPIIPNWRIDRYGDIWGGYICKKLIDIKGDLLTVGEPLIFHHKEGNVNRNMLQEHYSHIVNLQFCDIIDKACENIKPTDYLDMYEQLVTNLQKLESVYPVALKDYLKPTCARMGLWTKALRLKSVK